LDSQVYTDLVPDNQPVLGCQPDGKVLYRANLDGSTKYFFSDPAKPNTRLYMFGCQGLVDAMGFQLTDATEIAPNFIDNLKIFSVADEDDISCISGVSVGSGVKWKTGSDVEKIVAQGTDLGFTSYEAVMPNGSAAPLSISAETGRCDWIQKIFLGSGLLVTGKSPDDFYNQSCELTITAAAKTPIESSLKFKILTAQAKPVISTDCQLNSKLAKPENFKACNVKPDKGLLKMNVKPAANCSDVFKLDPSTSRLSLIGLPLLGVSCQAEFSAELNGVSADIVAIAVGRFCDVGTKPNSDGICEVIMCDSTHKYNDFWTVPSNEKNGNELKHCKADGSTEDLGIDSCFSGYEKRSSQCLKSCDSGFLEGDVRKSKITNGSLTEICSSGNISKLRTCNSDALLRDTSCLLTCDQVHVDDGKPWDAAVINGTQKNWCAGTTLKTGDITCSSGYLLRDGTCKIACDAEHAAGKEWFSDITNGTQKNICNDTGKITSTITCNGGYHVEGNSCEKDERKNCGNILDGNTYVEIDCATGGEYRNIYKCDNGSLKLQSSSKIGNICH
jgi:hypothetical protein